MKRNTDEMYCGICKSREGKEIKPLYDSEKDIFKCPNCKVESSGIIARGDIEELKLHSRKRLNELKNKKPSFSNRLKCFFTGCDPLITNTQDIEITHTNVFRQAKFDGIRKTGICKRCYKSVEIIERV